MPRATHIAFLGFGEAAQAFMQKQPNKGFAAKCCAYNIKADDTVALQQKAGDLSLHFESASADDLQQTTDIILKAFSHSAPKTHQGV